MLLKVRCWKCTAYQPAVSGVEEHAHALPASMPVQNFALSLIIAVVTEQNSYLYFLFLRSSTVCSSNTSASISQPSQDPWLQNLFKNVQSNFWTYCRFTFCIAAVKSCGHSCAAWNCALPVALLAS